MITFQAATDFLLAVWKNRNKVLPPTIFLIGPPGIGKTSVPAAVIPHMGPTAQLEVLDLTSRLPEDIGGLPFREGGLTRYSPQEWAVRFSQPDAVGCIVFDDLPAASAATAAAVRQVVLDRRINGVTLAPGVLVVVTGNRREDMAGAMTLPSHFRNSVCMLEMSAQLAPWSAWFAAHGGDPTILSFLSWRPALFSTSPSEADRRGRFATPRTWTMLSSHLPSAEQAGCVNDVVEGYVGEGACMEFVAFRQTVMGLPAIQDIFMNPRVSLPTPKETLNSPDRIVAVTTGLGHHAVMQVAKMKKGGVPAHRNPDALEAMGRFFDAVAWVTGDDVEHAAAAVVAYSTLGGSKDLLQVFGSANPEVNTMLRRIRAIV